MADLECDQEKHVAMEDLVKKKEKPPWNSTQTYGGSRTR
jgi:hypothetical protein